MNRLFPVLALTAALAVAYPLIGQAQAPTAAAKPDKAGVLPAAQARLAWSLMEKLAGDGDITISPASLAAAFEALTPGADSSMRRAIAKALGFNARETTSGFDALGKAREGFSVESDILRMANRIVLAPGVKPAADVSAALERMKIAVSSADLTKPEAVKEIDDWVSEKTKGKIPTILGAPLDKPAFVALNALYFKGKWKAPFDPALTTATPFTTADGKTADVQMMRLTKAERSYRVDKTFVAVSLPFIDERYALVVVTSIDKPLALKDFAPASGWLSGVGFEMKKGDLALPRFSVASRVDLLPALDKLGLDKARQTPGALAKFGAHATITQILQRATMDVDEEGAEAAAATAIVGTRSLDADDSVHMSVDKPFIYALRDNQSGLILIAGYVTTPPKGKES